MLRLLLISMMLLTLNSFATDGGVDEATFTNDSDPVVPMFCYRDVNDRDYLCQVAVAGGIGCQGDAIGGDIGSNVFKAPNKTSWHCDLFGTNRVKCESDDLFSSFLITAAAAANGFANYFEMSFDHFTTIMGNKPIVRCDSELNPISNEIWVPTNHTHRVKVAREQYPRLFSARTASTT